MSDLVTLARVSSNLSDELESSEPRSPRRSSMAEVGANLSALPVGRAPRRWAKPRRSRRAAAEPSRTGETSREPNPGDAQERPEEDGRNLVRDAGEAVDDLGEAAQNAGKGPDQARRRRVGGQRRALTPEEIDLISPALIQSPAWVTPLKAHDANVCRFG